MAEAILFQHKNFHGDHRHLFQDEPDLSGDDNFNDVTSSIIILGGQWDFYRDSNFRVQEGATLGPGMYSWVEDYNISNDSISSAHYVPGT